MREDESRFIINEMLRAIVFHRNCGALILGDSPKLALSTTMSYLVNVKNYKLNN